MSFVSSLLGSPTSSTPKKTLVIKLDSPIRCGQGTVTEVRIEFYVQTYEQTEYFFFEGNWLTEPNVRQAYKDSLRRGKK